MSEQQEEIASNQGVRIESTSLLHGTEIGIDGTNGGEQSARKDFPRNKEREDDLEEVCNIHFFLSYYLKSIL